MNTRSKLLDEPVQGNRRLFQNALNRAASKKQFPISISINGVDAVTRISGTWIVLDSFGLNPAYAIAVSPNGRLVGGDVLGKGVLWENRLPRLLTVNSNSVEHVDAVSDNGFAGGSYYDLSTDLVSGYIFDPRTQTTALVDDWLLAEGILTPDHVTGVNALYWDGQMLHLALSGENAAFVISIRLTPQQLDLEFRLRQVQQSLTVSWSTNFSGVVELQCSSVMGPLANWQAVTNLPSVIGDRYVVSIQPDGGSRFYRLAKTGN
jgi:hypothetical protein